jgi:hypothetical protein
MARTAIDQNALIEMFSSATAKQGEQLRDAVRQATLGALQGRELTLKNIRGVLKTVAEAANTGLAKNTTPNLDVEAMLDGAVAGMDDALLKAVDANRAALQQFVDQGVGLQEKQLKKALGDLEKFEDTMIEAMKKSAESAGAPFGAQWEQVLDKLQLKGTMAGAQATSTVEQFASQMQSVHTALRDSRAAGVKAAQALAESYSALVSGVLIGMSDALREGGAAAAAKPKGRK